MNIFLAPHSDDEALFGSIIIQRTKPLVIICTDGTIHQKKFNISTETRREESRQAAKILGVQVEFLGLPEETLTEKLLWKELTDAWIGPWRKKGVIFAPTKQGGQPQHDIVSDAAKQFINTYLVLYYGTYSRENFTPQGEIPLFPTAKELAIKEQALACFVSQLEINKPHFDAVRNVPEYLSFKPC